MCEEAKILRALIDELGFEVVETVKEVPYVYRTDTIAEAGIGPTSGLHKNTSCVKMDSTKRITEYSLRVKD